MNGATSLRGALLLMESQLEYHQRQLVVRSDPFYLQNLLFPPARCARSVEWRRSQ